MIMVIVIIRVVVVIRMMALNMTTIITKTTTIMLIAPELAEKNCREIPRIALDLIFPECNIIFLCSYYCLVPKINKQTNKSKKYA